MKKFLALILALCMVLSLAACGNNNATVTEEPTAEPTAEPTGEPTAEPTLEELLAELHTVAEGKLTVATSPDFAPYEFYAIDENGSAYLAGFDLALAQYIADFMGLELDVIPMDFDGVLAEIATGSVDIGLAGLSPDPNRMDAMDFSDIYYYGGQSFVTTTENAELFASLEDANNPDYSIGAQTGSIQYNLAVENTPDADIINLAKVTDIVAELVNGTLDGAFIETVVAKNYAANYPELFIVCDVPYDVAGSAVGVTKGNDTFLTVLNMAIAAALEDGSMDKFVAEANELASGEIYEGIIEEGTEPTA